MNEFHVANGTLLGYYGSDSTVIIPQGITRNQWFGIKRSHPVNKVIIPESVQHISDGEKVVNARVVNPLGTNNDCLWKGETSLTNPSGRNLVFDGATYAYHTVDQLGFTLYLQRKATANGIVSNVSQHSYDKESASHIYKALTKTVNQSGYYRISAYFYTDHDAHQFEDFGTATSWMWVD
ncbi:MAG: hypothetical protein IJC41_05380 [Firmicutes bacterium]|nr:hypothetical protein [Bacillota bacterium]